MSFVDSVAQTALRIDSAFFQKKQFDPTTTKVRMSLKEVEDAYSQPACIVLSAHHADLEFIPQICNAFFMDITVVPKTLSPVPHKTLDDPLCKDQGEKCLQKFRKVKTEKEALRMFLNI